MLCESQKVTLIGLLNETKTWENKTWLKFLAAILSNSDLDTDLSLVICAGNFMFVQGELAEMKVFMGQKWNFRKTAFSAWYATESTLHIHKHRNPDFKSLSHLILEHCVLGLVSKFTHFGNKDFLPVFFESLCVWVFVDALSVYKTPK